MAASLVTFGIEMPPESLASPLVRPAAPESAGPVAVLVVGPELPPSRSREILARWLEDRPDSPALNIAIGLGDEAELFQEFVNDNRVFYVSRGRIEQQDLAALVRAAAVRGAGEFAPARIPSAALDGVLNFALELPAPEQAWQAGELLTRNLRELLRADASHWLVYDPQNETLWSETAGRERRTESVVAGLTGFVARTGQTVRVDHAERDGRYDADADNPSGEKSCRFMAAPIPGPAGPAGVVTVLRSAGGKPFDENDAEVLRVLAECAAPVFAGAAIRARIRDCALQGERTVEPQKLYRDEALNHLQAASGEDGRVLRTPGPWLRFGEWALAATLMAGFVYTAVAKVHEIAAGSAVVRARSKIVLTARSGGLVRAVDVAAGSRVRAGDLLLRFHERPGTAAADRVPEQVRAPSDGVVSDIRVRSGQEVTPGDQLISIVDESAGFELISLLPGPYAPQLRPQTSLNLKLEGYPDSQVTIAIDNVSAEVLGPREALRYAGKESADAFTASGPVVITRSALPPTFRAGTRSYRYRDGMTGRAEVAVRESPLILSLVPGLREAMNP